MEVKLKLQNKGYTLLEALVVINILSLVVLMFITSLNVNVQALKFNQEILIINKSIDQARICAIDNKSQIKIDKKQITVSCPGGKKIYKFTASLTSNFQNGEMKFSKLGKLTQAGTISITNGFQVHQMKINIGYGYES